MFEKSLRAIVAVLLASLSISAAAIAPAGAAFDSYRE
jgi:hypothetical protein